MDRIGDLGMAPHDSLEQALQTWAREPGLAAPLAAPGAAYLVLDGEGARLLHASSAARDLARMVADGTAILPRIAGQIPRAGFSGTAPRLLRLRLDARRIAPPAVCLLARGQAADGTPLVLLLPTGPLSLPRRRDTPGPASVQDRPAPEPPSETAPAPRVGDRFVWASDAGDAITRLSGLSGEPLAALVGLRWEAVVRSDPASGEDTLRAALAARRTFRAVPAILAVPGLAPVAVDLSGAPLARSEQPFAGYGGFGLIRPAAASVQAVPVEEKPEPAHPSMAADTPAATPAEPEVPASEPEPAAGDAPTPEVPVPAPDLPAVPFPGVGDDTGGVPAEVGVASPSETDPVYAPSPPPKMEKTLSEAPETTPTDTASDLSSTEHAAFREIARALGARYAGDETAPEADPAELAPPRAAGGAVMPFPGTWAAPAEAGVDPAAILEGLPAAILIHRGDGILAANRRLLDLTGFSDLAALAQAGIDRLFPRLPPGRPDEPAVDAPVLLKTADGRSRPVAVRRGRLPWQGAPATSLLLQEASEDDPARERAAERIARSFRDAHAAEAAGTLDALDDGIVTVDGAGRVLALNRSAAALFACAPREVVGNAFAGLFEAQAADAVRTALRVPGSDPVPVSVRGAALTLRIAQAGSEGRRVAVLRARQPAPPARDRSASFARFAGEIRTPVTGILGLAEAMESERLGPLGDGRQRGCLHEIRASGEHVLGLLSDLVDLATIEAGGLAMTVGPLALNDLVAGCVARLQPQAASGHIVLRTSFSPDLALLEADAPSLSRAASAVIANAIRLTGAGGQVIVSTMPAERGAVALRVRDTGAGMSADEVAAALEPFREGAASGLRPDGRGGLGLPLTRALVEANHGRLLVSSRKDEGTLVEILLPGRQAMTA